MTGIVYTETTVFSPPERYAADAPYQLAIVELEDGERRTVRIDGTAEDGKVAIGDRVRWVADRDGVAYFAKTRCG